MAYGFQAINESDFLQIDDASSQFLVIQTGTVTSPYLTIPNSFPEDIVVVVRPHNPDTSRAHRVRGYMFDYTLSGGTRIRRAYMASNDDRYTYQNSACDYAILERVSAGTLIEPSSGYGLNVYTSSGVLGYTSAYPTYRVKSTRTLALSASVSGHGIWHTPSGTDQVLGMYAYLASYSEYRSRQYSIGGHERGNTDYVRLAHFDYPNNQFGTYVQSSYSDGLNGGSIYDYVYAVLRTEMVGYIT